MRTKKEKHADNVLFMKAEATLFMLKSKVHRPTKSIELAVADLQKAIDDVRDAYAS